MPALRSPRPPLPSCAASRARTVLQAGWVALMVVSVTIASIVPWNSPWSVPSGWLWTLGVVGGVLGTTLIFKAR